MRKILVPLIGAACLAGLPLSNAFAADATIDQVHAMAAAGRTDEALSMMNGVLRDHPASAKAHYVEAQLYARANRPADGARELAQAQQLSPGLPFASKRAAAELTRQVSVAVPANPAAPLMMAQRQGMSWTPVLLTALVAIGAVLLLRRRLGTGPSAVDGYAPVAGNPWPGQSAYRGMPLGWSNGPVQGGMGSSLLGGLAAGAVMGAGFAVGEDVVGHMFGERERGVDAGPGGSADQYGINQDMGGADFGISDGRSWDDGSAGSGW